MAEAVNKKRPTVEEMEAEIKEQELALKKLEILEKQANLQDIQERLAERQMVRTNKDQRSRGNGNTLRQNEQKYTSMQAHCNHKKGGNGVDGIVNGQGDDSQYAVLKHQFPWGDIWVRCLRCAKTWKPPVEMDFYFDENGVSVAKHDGKFNKERFETAVKEYKEAVAFQTRNVMSGSYQFRFTSTDPSKLNAETWVREQLSQTNLR